MTFGRLARAGLALGLGLVVLSGAGGTSASWVEQVERDPGTIRAGSVTVTTDEHRVELHSRQPSGSRTYASTSTCVPDSGFTECRVITNTLSREGLISGDRVVVTERASLAARGTNLEGVLEVQVSSLTSGPGSAFGSSAEVTTRVTPPSGDAVTGASASFPVEAASGTGIGTYTARMVITTPASDSGGSWGTRVTGQQLYEGTVDYTFVQS